MNLYIFAFELQPFTEKWSDISIWTTQRAVLRFMEFPSSVQLHCQNKVSLRALCEAMKSGPQLLSTSVLPFPSFLLSLSLSPVITVKVQLQCLRWKLSQRCVTAMWCFTRLVTKPPVVIHTCGINKSSSLLLSHSHTHALITYYLQTHFLFRRFIFLFDQTPQKSIQVFLLLAFQEQFWQDKWKRNTVLQQHWIDSVCSHSEKNSAVC